MAKSPLTFPVVSTLAVVLAGSTFPEEDPPLPIAPFSADPAHSARYVPDGLRQRTEGRTASAQSHDQQSILRRQVRSDPKPMGSGVGRGPAVGKSEGESAFGQCSGPRQVHEWVELE